MLDNIKSYYNSENVCIENLYISMCKALNRNYKNMYAYSWNFGYLREEQFYYKKIKPSRDGQSVNYEQNFALEKYCGIKPIWHINCNMDNLVDYVKKELAENRPVGLGIDIYSCNWHIFYNKYHFIHYCLIIGIDEQGLICIDDTLDNENDECALPIKPSYVRIDFKTFEKYRYGFITFDISRVVLDYSKDDLIYLSALKTLTGHDGFSDYDYMRNLLSDIKTDFDINRELGEVKDLKAIEIVRTFACIAWSRSNYCKFLREKKENCILNIDLIAEKIMESSHLWKEISGYILKTAITSRSKFQNESIYKNLSQIIKLEEDLAKYILNEYETKVLLL